MKVCLSESPANGWLTMYSGGLSTSFAALWSNIYLSGMVALIGISLPIGTSYVLMGLLNATPVEAFAAGAALCSTSLGTTFTILTTSGLEKSRLGVILSSAAMIDDVAGLVMVQVISNLGTSAGSFTAVTVIRPVFVSIAFAVVVPAICWAVVRPLTKYFFSKIVAGPRSEKSAFSRWACTPIAAFIAHTLILLGLVTGSTYAGTSNLFAAYIAGAAVNWWDALVNKTLEERRSATPKEKSAKGKKASSAQDLSIPGSQGSSVNTPSSDGRSSDVAEQQEKRFVSPIHHELTGAVIHERLYAPAMTSILKPFFFVSPRIPGISFPQLTRTSGIDRLLHPHHSNVPGCHCLARYRVHHPHAVGQTGLWPRPRTLHKHIHKGAIARSHRLWHIRNRSSANH